MYQKTGIQYVVAAALVFTTVPSIGLAKTPMKSLPVGEISGSTEGRGTFRLGLGWRNDLFPEGKWDYVVSPSLDVSTESGRATLVSLDPAKSSLANGVSPGLSVMFIKTRTDASVSAMSSGQTAAGAILKDSYQDCSSRCTGTFDGRDKGFCDKYHSDPERDDVIKALKAWIERLSEQRWKKDAGLQAPVDTDQAGKDAKIIGRVIDLDRSTNFPASGRSYSRKAESRESILDSLGKLQKALDELAKDQKRTNAKVVTSNMPEVLAVDAQIRDVGNALEMVNGIVRSRPMPPEMRSDDLCPAGKANYEERIALLEYPAWWVEPGHVSAGLRGGVSRGEYFETAEGSATLNKHSVRYGSFLGAVSTGWLLHGKDFNGQRATPVIEGVLGVEHARTASTKSIEWCGSPGSVQVDMSNVEAKQCSKGVLGKPELLDRFYGAAFVGGVFTRTGAFRLQFGGAVAAYRRGDGPRVVDFSLLLPISIVSTGQEFKSSFVGVVRLAPAVRWQWQGDRLAAGSSPAFLLTLQVMAQRGFWADPLSWL
jgi:hypothetical protein